MTIGTSLVLIAVGAILKFAVTGSVSGIDIQTVGVFLSIVGGVGQVPSLLYRTLWSRNRRDGTVVERERVRDDRY